eukprot:GGOE01019370.1.p1 GENE.GGOE01019370.1~~GGOE01019370.1.p1  ORF type:complete len:655 (+),score=145.86 GGOE01019370.1:51-2015(+)
MMHSPRTRGPSPEPMEVGQQSAQQLARDEAFALSLAREEADRALTMQLTGMEKPDLDVSGASGLSGEASSTTGGWVPMMLPQPTSAPSDSDSGSPSRSQQPLQALHIQAQVAVKSLQLKVATRAIVVGSFASLLLGLSLLYFFGYVLVGEWSASDYEDPLFYTIASGMLYIFLFLLAILGLLASCRRSLCLVTAYLLGLILATTAKVIMSVALALLIKGSLLSTLAGHGCWTLTGLAGYSKWSSADCHQYFNEAITAAWVWVFPVFFCLAYIVCTAWMRLPMVSLEFLRHKLAQEQDGAGVDESILWSNASGPMADLEAQAHASSGGGGCRTLDESQNNARILCEFRLDAVPGIHLTMHSIMPEDDTSMPTPGVKSGQPGGVPPSSIMPAENNGRIQREFGAKGLSSGAAVAYGEHVRFVPICPPPSWFPRAGAPDDSSNSAAGPGAGNVEEKASVCPTALPTVWPPTHPLNLDELSNNERLQREFVEEVHVGIPEGTGPVTGRPTSTVLAPGTAAAAEQPMASVQTAAPNSNAAEAQQLLTGMRAQPQSRLHKGKVTFDEGANNCRLQKEFGSDIPLTSSAASTVARQPLQDEQSQSPLPDTLDTPIRTSHDERAEEAGSSAPTYDKEEIAVSPIRNDLEDLDLNGIDINLAT